MNIWRSTDQVVEVAAPSGAAVVTTDQIKAQIRVDHDDEDALLDAIVAAAESHVERTIQRFLRPRQVTLRLSGLPCGRVPVALPGGAVSALTSIEIDGEAFAGCVALGDSPARLVPDAEWPRPQGQGYPVVITYTAGYATVPADLIAAVKMIAAELYERREVSSTDGATALPLNAMVLLRPHRIWAGV